MCPTYLGSSALQVASAVLASVAMPFLIPSRHLVCKGADGELRPWFASTEAGAAPDPDGRRA